MPSINGIDLGAIAKLVENLGASNNASQNAGSSGSSAMQPDAFASGAGTNSPQATLIREIELLLKLLLEIEQSQNGATPLGQQSRGSGSATPASYGSPASATPAGSRAAAGPGEPTAPGAANAGGPTGPAPTAGSINDRIAQAAQQLCGTSSTDGPDGGNLACAFEVNKVLARAGVAPLGDNPNYVPSVEAALQGGRGVQVSAAQAQSGDIAIAGNGHHIGIVTGAGASSILSNSSGKDSFSWQSSGAGFDQYFGAPTRYYRVTN